MEDNDSTVSAGASENDDVNDDQCWTTRGLMAEVYPDADTDEAMLVDIGTTLKTGSRTKEERGRPLTIQTPNQV